MKTENSDRSTYARLAITFAKNLSCLDFNEQVCIFMSIYSSIYSIYRMHVCMYSVCMCKCVYIWYICSVYIYTVLYVIRYEYTVYLMYKY